MRRMWSQDGSNTVFQSAKTSPLARSMTASSRLSSRHCHRSSSISMLEQWRPRKKQMSKLPTLTLSSYNVCVMKRHWLSDSSSALILITASLPLNLRADGKQLCPNSNKPKKPTHFDSRTPSFCQRYRQTCKPLLRRSGASCLTSGLSYLTKPRKRCSGASSTK